MLASTVSSDSDLINGFNKALATPRPGVFRFNK